MDSEKYIRLLYKLELEDEGYTVVPSANLKEAAKVLKGEQVDLIVLGAELSDMLRIKDLEEIVGSKRDVPCIVNSIFPDAKEFFMQLGAEEYVEKSSNLKKLKRAVRTCLTQYRKRPAMEVQGE